MLFPTTAADEDRWMVGTGLIDEDRRDRSSVFPRIEVIYLRIDDCYRSDFLNSSCRWVQRIFRIGNFCSKCVMVKDLDMQSTSNWFCTSLFVHFFMDSEPDFSFLIVDGSFFFRNYSVGIQTFYQIDSFTFDTERFCRVEPKDC